MLGLISSVIMPTLLWQVITAAKAPLQGTPATAENTFSVDLITPCSGTAARKTCKGGKLNEENINNFISKLAKRFDVSEQAITIRLTNLGLIDYSEFAA